ncbi:hypothetical protein [Mycolicibacterium hippocampi]|uniref:hypothetical protein n=1 Tax=Mycolicibacterium hippocampi TaxID=659824 RepID=UPI0021F3C673|nr:hypothetical protein [Mycolicibacterium hippocampi]
MNRWCTSADAGIKTVTFAVVDADGNESLVPAVSVVTVVGVPGASLAPVVVATPVAAGTTDAEITISPVVVITDLDSDDLGSATVTLNDAGHAGGGGHDGCRDHDQPGGRDHRSRL